MHRILLATLATLGLAAAGCGAGPTGSCDFRNGSVNGAEPRCQEWIGGVVTVTGTYEATCTTVKGLYRSGECPRDGIVAGCEQKTNNADGSRTIDWYYAPKTAADIMSSCKSPDTYQAKP